MISSIVRGFFFYMFLILTVILVTCVIMQKNGAGLHTASSCFWDNTTDGKFIYFQVESVFFCLCLKINVYRKLYG